MAKATDRHKHVPPQAGEAGGGAVPEVEELIAEGREQGYLPAERVHEALRDVELTAEAMDEILVLLHDLEIDVLEGDDEHREPGSTEPVEAEAEQVAPRELDLSVKSATSDPVRLYLRDIGKVNAAHGRTGGLAGAAHGARRRGRPSASWSRPTCASWSPSRGAMRAAA